MQSTVSTIGLELDESLLAAEVLHLFRIAWRLTGNAHDAEDLVQDVCERALARAPGFATREDCRRWLLRVLYNRFVDGKRHGQRSPIAAGDPDAALAAARDEAAGPEEQAVRSDSEAALERAWGRLEPAQQALLLLRAEGHDLDDIARITSLDKPAISSRLHRARSSLGKFMKQEAAADARRAPPEKTR